MSKICLGCGNILQIEDEHLAGYTPDIKKDYCKRCFRLKNYGERKENETVDEVRILTKVNQSHGIAFFLMDFLNINQKNINLFNKIKIPKYFVISKSDTLRKEMKPEKIKLWLKKVYNIDQKILWINNKKEKTSSNLFKIMDEKNTNIAYIMGITNAGKSTLINKLLKEQGIKKEILATNKPNTTLDFIKLRIGEYTLYDTPGFSYENSDSALITKEIKPITYQIKPHTTLVINDRYRIHFKEKNKVTFYGTTKINREYKVVEEKYPLKVEKNHDLVFPGIGFLNIKEKGQILSNKENLEIRLDISEVEYE